MSNIFRTGAIALCAFFSFTFCVKGGGDFTPPKSYLGSADKDGCLYFWTDLPSLSIKDGTKLPLRLRYSSGQKVGAPLFGRFWWCPLLESTLVSTQENTIEFTTLGGRRVALSSGKDGSYASGDGRFTARTASPTETILSGEGWEYRFVAGKLRSAKTSAGTELEWVYQGTRLISINDKTLGPLLSLVYVADQSIPGAVVVGKERIDFQVQQVPVATEVMGQLAIAGYQPSVSDIRTKYDWFQLPVRLDRDGSYIMDYRYSQSLENTYVWSAKDGRLKREGEFTYETSATAEGAVLVSRKDKQGGIESYSYNEHNGTSTHSLPDGRVTSRVYFISRGPTQFKLRKILCTQNGKELVNRQWSYDELGRKIRERNGQVECLWEWYENGQMASMTERVGDSVLTKESYDQDGRTTESVADGRVYRYLYEGGKTVIQKVKDGKVINTKIADAVTGQSFFFPSDSQSKVLEGSNATFGISGSPQDLEIARELALKAIKSQQK